jgi:hypothetical protein
MVRDREWLLGRIVAEPDLTWRGLLGELPDRDIQASVVKWSQRQRATGSAAAKQMGGYRKRLLEPHRELVLKRMLEDPHVTVRQMVVELAEMGIATCPTSVWRLARSGGLRFKNVWPAPSARGFIQVATDKSASTYTA